ncbi:MAG: hypothetical protein ACUVRV_10235 [Cyanobacteriota bacterium]
MGRSPLSGVCQAGTPVSLSYHGDPKRKLAYTWEMIQVDSATQRLRKPQRCRDSGSEVYCGEFAPGAERDPCYAQLFWQVVEVGVEILPYRLRPLARHREQISPAGIYPLGLAKLVNPAVD